MKELKFRGYTIPFVLISSDASGADDYIKDGAIAFVAKIDMGSELAPAVASAYSGELYVSQSAGTGHVRLADLLGPVPSSTHPRTLASNHPR
jgi:hypothetical protein